MIKKLFLSGALLSLLFVAMMVFPVYADGENVIKNGNFENVTGNLPSDWKVDSFEKDPGVTKYSIEGNSHDGSKCMVIENTKKNDAKLVQEVKLQLGKVYKISYWIKAENFDVNAPTGGNLTVVNGIFESKPKKDTKGQWEKVETYARVRSSGDDIMQVALRVGGFGTEVAGKVYYDDISIVLVDNPPPGTAVDNFFIAGNTSNNSNAQSQDKDSSKGGSNTTLIIIVAIAIVVGLLVFVEVKFAKRGRKGTEGSPSNKADDNSDDDYEDEDESDE